MPTVNVNNVELYYEIHGHGEPLVLIHGLQGDVSNFQSLVPLLARRFRVLLFDQRGSGASDKPAGVYSVTSLADDTAALLRKLGMVPCHALGTSMGGMVAQQLALRYPEVIRRLILACTSPGGPRAVAPAPGALDAAYTLEEIEPRERARRLAQASFTPGYLAAHSEIIDALTQARRERPLHLPALARRISAFEAHDAFDRLKDIDLPTLVLTGSPDTIIPEANSEILEKEIPNARRTVLAPAGHLFWIEREAETVAAVTDFLTAA